MLGWTINEHAGQSLVIIRDLFLTLLQESLTQYHIKDCQYAERYSYVNDS